MSSLHIDQLANTYQAISPLPNVFKPYGYVTAICHIFVLITRNFFVYGRISFIFGPSIYTSLALIKKRIYELAIHLINFRLSKK